LLQSTNKTDLHDITEILLKVALNTINHHHHQEKKIVEKKKNRTPDFNIGTSIKCRGID
jgi:hypothetical protein